MNKKELSIIIPFLNEGEEIENTIESILEFSNNDVEIILINDASNDNFDYKSLSLKYNIQYIENTKRLGVAASRDLGVNLCTTPHFLLLDGHMRFYEKNWVSNITNILKNNPKYFLCCQTKVLSKDKNGLIHTNHTRPETFGAAVDLFNPHSLFLPRWTFNRDDLTKDDILIDIPCVLGAGYACSKEYWQYLNGLEGLMYYGYDETYISIKVWLSGGKCKLLRDIIIGHIYRDSPPYNIEHVYITYNKLLLNELLVPDEHIKILRSKLMLEPYFDEASKLIYENETWIKSTREYYKKILKNDFSLFEAINLCYGNFINLEDEKEMIKKIANHLVTKSSSSKDIGLLNGKMGSVLFLYHYSRYMACPVFKELANNLLEEVCTSLSIHLSYSFQSGLTGIGWAIEYLFQNNFIDVDINDFLEEIDNKVIEINTSRVKDLSLNSGLAGIVHYVLSRLYSINQTEIKNPFNDGFLVELYKKVKYVLESSETVEHLNIYIRYAKYYEVESRLPPSSIYDIVSLTIPHQYNIEEYALGLNGNSGVGLKLILEETRNKKYDNVGFDKEAQENIEKVQQINPF